MTLHVDQSVKDAKDGLHYTAITAGSHKNDVIEHYESQSGQRAVDLRLVKQKSATVSLTIEEFTKENLALALYGNHETGTGGRVTDKSVGGDAPVGEADSLQKAPLWAALSKNDARLVDYMKQNVPTTRCRAHRCRNHHRD